MLSYKGAVIQGGKGIVINDRVEGSVRGSTQHGIDGHNNHRYNKGKGKVCDNGESDQKRWKAHKVQSYGEGSGKATKVMECDTNQIPSERLAIQVTGLAELPNTDIGLNFSDHKMKMLETFLGDESHLENGDMSTGIKNQHTE